MKKIILGRQEQMIDFISYIVYLTRRINEQRHVLKIDDFQDNKLLSEKEHELLKLQIEKTYFIRNKQIVMLFKLFPELSHYSVKSKKGVKRFVVALKVKNFTFAMWKLPNELYDEVHLVVDNTRVNVEQQQETMKELDDNFMPITQVDEQISDDDVEHFVICLVSTLNEYAHEDETKEEQVNEDKPEDMQYIGSFLIENPIKKIVFSTAGILGTIVTLKTVKHLIKKNK